MPSAQVSSYTAHVGLLGQLGSERVLVLSHRVLEDGRAAEVSTSDIYFSDRFAASAVGFCTIGAADRVQAHLPTADYQVWLDLLRNESPVYLHWSVPDEPGTPEADGIVHLGTGPEPTGEGPVDFSP